MARNPNQAISEAQAQIEASLQRKQDTGMDSVEQAYARAADDGVMIEGDPTTTRMEQVPEEYQQDLPPLTMAQLTKWNLTPGEIAKLAQQGILGDEYADRPLSDLRSAALEQGRQMRRQLQIDAGVYAEKSHFDPLFELYWEGKAPHPKTGRMVVKHSIIAQRTERYGINGRIWSFEKGRQYMVPSEIMNVMAEKSAALRDFAAVSMIFQNRPNVSIPEKVRQQGGDRGMGWAEAQLVNTTDRMFQ
jgi:hypothetical protein